MGPDTDLRELAHVLEQTYGRGRNHRLQPSVSGEPDTPLGTLIVTILSQASTDARTRPIYRELISTFPDWDQLASAHPERVEEILRPGGLARQKRRYVQGALRRIHSDMGGYCLDQLRNWTDEDCYQYLTSLPGVGLKTAACVLLFGLGRDVFPVDTHVARICRRLGLVDAAAPPERIHRQLHRLVPPGRALDLHLNLLEHGRKVCRASGPDCAGCPVRHLCAWGTEDQPSGMPASDLGRAERKK